MDQVWVIPARYASTRLPGKPLVKIAGVEMLLRVWRVAQLAAQGRPGVRVVVATDDERILAFAREHTLDAVMTDPACPSGTDRARQAIERLGATPDAVVNLQGDNPTCPPWFVAALADELTRRPDAPVATPCVRLTWAELDALREHKKTAPGSGTFVTAALTPEAGPPGAPALASGWALSFSKGEMPRLRNEAKEREKPDATGLTGPDALSPFLRHVGLYSYRRDALEAFASWPPSPYETLEGLEQLRFLEHSLPVRVVEVSSGGRALMSGVDAPADVERAEAYFLRYGEYE